MAKQIRALLFDFDGLIIDTETPAYESWREIYEEHGHDLPLERWSLAVGTVGGFDPAGDLGRVSGRRFERVALDEQRRRRKMELLEGKGALPGVMDYLDAADDLDLARAIVSSDTTEWVTGHLARLGLSGGWSLILCADGDQARAKPHPALYLEALERLELDASEAIVFEDSPNGVRAAKAAGIYCVTIPNPVTESLDLGGADLRIESLDRLPLRALLASL